MVCTQCGKDCLEGSVFCTGCGTRLSESTPATTPSSLTSDPAPVSDPVYIPAEEPEYTPYVPEYVSPVPTEEYTPVKKRSKLPLIIAIAAFAVVAILLIVLLGGNKVESVAEDFLSAVFEDDASGVEEFFHKKMNRDGDDYIYENIDDYDIDIVGSIEALPSDYDYFADIIDKDGEDLDGAYYVFFSCTVEYDGEEYEGYGDIRVFEYDGEWYVRGRDLNMEDDFYDDYDE